VTLLYLADASLDTPSPEPKLQRERQLENKPLFDWKKPFYNVRARRLSSPPVLKDHYFFPETGRQRFDHIGSTMAARKQRFSPRGRRCAAWEHEDDSVRQSRSSCAHI
jgi:hypothetical protein